jgi:hypothetical protein
MNEGNNYARGLEPGSWDGPGYRHRGLGDGCLKDKSVYCSGDRS